VREEIERAAGLIERLVQRGAVSQETTDALLDTEQAAVEIGRGLGEHSSARDVLLATILVDDSTSIGRLVPEVRYGHSLLLDALASESTTADVQVLTRALNRGVIAPYKSLSRATPLTEANFSGRTQIPHTPLYLQTVLTLGTVLAKAHELEGKVRTFTLIITDGMNEATSAPTTARDVRAIVADMMQFATNHIVAGMGIGEYCDFRAVFREMGIPERWILTTGVSAAELRAKFRQIAESLMLAASSEAEFQRQLASGP
jgi:hypothetical protein